MYIDVLGSWDTGGRRLTINSGFSYYPSTPDFAFSGDASLDRPSSGMPPHSLIARTITCLEGSSGVHGNASPGRCD